MADLAPYIAALPAVATVIRIISTLVSNGHEKRLARHIELLNAAPKKSLAREDLGRLVDEESKLLRERLQDRMGRKLNGPIIAAMFLVLIIVTPVVWGLWTWSTQPLPALAQFTLQAAAVLIGGFGTLLVTVGGGSQLFTSREVDQGPTKT